MKIHVATHGSVIEAEVIRETEKTYIVGERKTIVGWMGYLPSHVRKSEHTCFETKVDALKRLVERAKANVDNEQKNLDRALKELDKLQALFEEEIAYGEDK